MRDVPRRHVGERANGKRVSAGDAAARPRVRRQIAEKRHGRSAHQPKLFDVAAPGPRIRAGHRHRNVLIEARKRSVEAARKPERAGDEEALAVVQVSQDVPDAPLVGGVAMERSILRDGLQQRQRFGQLVLEDPADVARSDLVDVREVGTRLPRFDRGRSMTLIAEPRAAVDRRMVASRRLLVETDHVACRIVNPRGDLQERRRRSAGQSRRRSRRSRRASPRRCRP